MSDNGFDNEQVDFEEGGDEHHENISDDRSRGSEENNNYGDDKVIKPRTDGGVGVSINGYIPNVLFISRFAPHTGRYEIEEFMGKFGTIIEVSIKGEIAFVEYERSEDATSAKESCHLQPGLGSDRLVVDFKRDVYIPAQNKRTPGGRFYEGGRGGGRGGRRDNYQSRYDQPRYDQQPRYDHHEGGRGRGGDRYSGHHNNSYQHQQQGPPPQHREYQQHAAPPATYPNPHYTSAHAGGAPPRPRGGDYGSNDYAPPAPKAAEGYHAPEANRGMSQHPPASSPEAADYHSGGRGGGRGGRGRGRDYYNNGGRGDGFRAPHSEGPVNDYPPAHYPPAPVPHYEQQQYPPQREFSGRGDYQGRGRGRGDYQGRGRQGYDFPPLQTARHGHGGRGGEEAYSTAPHRQYPPSQHAVGYPPADPYFDNRGPPPQPYGHAPYQGGRGGRGYSGGRGGYEDHRPPKSHRYDEHQYTAAPAYNAAGPGYYQQQQPPSAARHGNSSHHDAYSTVNRGPVYDDRGNYGRPPAGNRYEEGNGAAAGNAADGGEGVGGEANNKKRSRYEDEAV